MQALYVDNFDGSISVFDGDKRSWSQCRKMVRTWVNTCCLFPFFKIKNMAFLQHCIHWKKFIFSFFWTSFFQDAHFLTPFVRWAFMIVDVMHYMMFALNHDSCLFILCLHLQDRLRIDRPGLRKSLASSVASMESSMELAPQVTNIVVSGLSLHQGGVRCTGSKRRFHIHLRRPYIERTYYLARQCAVCVRFDWITLW